MYYLYKTIYQPYAFWIDLKVRKYLKEQQLKFAIVCIVCTLKSLSKINCISYFHPIIIDFNWFVTNNNIRTWQWMPHFNEQHIALCSCVFLISLLRTPPPPLSTSHILRLSPSSTSNIHAELCIVFHRYC